MTRWPHASRAGGPHTSVLGEREATRSGRRQTQLQRVLTVVRERPGLTAEEIAAYIPGVDRVAAARRLNDALRMGLVTQGPARRVSNRQQLTWQPVRERPGEQPRLM